MSKTILLLGAAGPAGSNFVQCLRMHNYPWKIIAVDSNPYHLELLQQVDKKVLVQGAPEGAVWHDQIDGLVRDHAVDLVWAQPDVMIGSLACQQRRWPRFTPGCGTVRVCQDKLRLYQALDGLVNQPAAEWREAYTSRLQFRRYVCELLVVAEEHPVWVRARRGAGSQCSIKAYSYAQIREWMDYWEQERGLTASQFIIQEFLPGPEYAFQSVWKGGIMICSAARQRLEYLGGGQSPTGQTSSPSVAVSVHNDDVNQQAVRAIQAAAHAAGEKPHGVFCVDLKTSREGDVCVTEINAGRFFTTSNFFAAAGCNMPQVACMLGCGMDPGPQRAFDAVPEGLYWIRQPDMGYTLCKGKPEFTS